MKTVITNRSTLKNIPLLMALCVLSLASVVQPSFAQTGYAVGKMGRVLRTIDGKKWDYIAPPTNDDIVGVSFVAPNNLWVVAHGLWGAGSKGSLIYPGSADGKWLGPAKIEDEYFRAISFKTVKNGITVGDGGAIFWTDDGGKTWNQSQNKKKENWTSQNLKDVFCLNAKDAWAAGDGNTILRTDDGGKTWAPPKAAVPPAIGPIQNISIVDAQTWWFAGPKGVLWTTNGGTTWNNFIYLGGFAGVQALKDKKGQNVWVAGTHRVAPADAANYIFDNPTWAAKEGAWSQVTDRLTYKTAGTLRGLSFIGAAKNPNAWVLADKGIFRNNFGDGKGWTSVYGKADVKNLSKIVMFLNPQKKPGVKLDQSATPSTGASGVDYLSLTASGFPEGNINPINVVIELATECHEAASATTSAVSIVSGSGDSQLLSFLLPSGLAPGQYFVSISDSEEGDANFESSNCSVVSVVK